MADLRNTGHDDAQLVSIKCTAVKKFQFLKSTWDVLRHRAKFCGDRSIVAQIAYRDLSQSIFSSEM